LAAFELFEERRVRGQCQNLLKVARRLLGKIGDLGQLLRGVMAEARELAKAERCSLFLLDKETGELVSKVFDGTEVVSPSELLMLYPPGRRPSTPSQSKQETKEVRIQLGKGIAGHVANTGKLLNIHNAYVHPLFYKGVDEQTGFKTR
jgi:cGMP-dependent 3',5'-cyclic phosphodiesterase